MSAIERLEDIRRSIKIDAVTGTITLPIADISFLMSETELRHDPVPPPAWNLFVKWDGLQCFATLAEDGKEDYSVEITQEQLPWFNALREGLRTEGHLMFRPEGK